MCIVALNALTCQLLELIYEFYSARWIGNHGFSIGIDDVQPGESLNQKKKQTIDKGYEVCDEVICLYNKGKLPLQSGCNAAETLEAEITKELNDIREATGKVSKEVLVSFYILVDSVYQFMIILIHI